MKVLTFVGRWEFLRFMVPCSFENGNPVDDNPVASCFDVHHGKIPTSKATPCGEKEEEEAAAATTVSWRQFSRGLHSQLWPNGKYIYIYILYIYIYVKLLSAND